MDAWQLARATAAEAGVELRALDGPDDALFLNEVITATWGSDAALSRDLVRALASSGNVPWGAFDGPTVVGFVLGWAGVDEDGLHVHSHQLATLPDRRRSGVGLALKFAQRAQALDQGIAVARWTFDPMIARNARLNMVRLGAIADRFHRDFYGEMHDEQNRGERSDRLVTRWVLTREPGPRAPAAPAARLAVPADRDALRAADPDAYREARERLARGLLDAFDRGLVVAGFDAETSEYLMAPRAEALTP